MKRKAGISHDKAIVRELRADSRFAVESPKAAIGDTGDPRVLLAALRHLAEARGASPKSPTRPAWNEG